MSINALYRQYLIDPSFYRFSAKLTGVLQNRSGECLTKEGDLLVAYSDHERRGIAEACLTEYSDQYFFPITFFSNNDREIINFKIIQAGQLREILLSERIPFEADATLGNFQEPFPFRQKECPQTLKRVSRNAVTLFPNPVYDKLQIYSGFKILSITINEMKGNCIKTISSIAENKLTLNTGFLKAGAFYVKIETDGGTFYRGLIKAVN